MVTQAATPALARPRRTRPAAAPATTTPAPSAGTMVLAADSGPLQTLQNLKWWAKLTAPEQSAVIEETKGLADALIETHDGMLRVGERLTKLQGILEPHSLFTRHISHFHLSKRTAYRYIARYKNVAQLPEPIVRLAMARNLALGGDTEVKPYGNYTEAVRKLPPPRNPTEEQAATWLNQVEQVAKETRQANLDAAPGYTLPEPTDPTTAMKEAYRFVANRYRQLPNNSRARSTWIKGLVGMLLTELGVSGPQQFSPTAVPEDFQVGRGRPRNPVAAA